MFRHCKSREVHCPEAHSRLSPQDSPSLLCESSGHVALLPVHVSWGSHLPVLSRHTVPFDANWHEEVQHSSLVGSHWALPLNLQVLASQQLLSPHPSSPPQSQSSPLSTMPLPHWLPVIVVMFLLSVKQVDLTLDLKPEQILPIEQGENSVIPLAVDGFMMYLPPASHVVLLSGQQDCVVDDTGQVLEVQS